MFQEEFVKLIGVSGNTISSIKRFQFTPTADTAQIICIALEKNLREVPILRRKINERIR